MAWSPVTSCEVLEEVVQIPGRAAGPAKLTAPCLHQLSIRCAAGLDAQPLLCVAICPQVEAQEAACKSLQVLLGRGRAIHTYCTVGLRSIKLPIGDGDISQLSIIPEVMDNLQGFHFILYTKSKKIISLLTQPCISPFVYIPIVCDACVGTAEIKHRHECCMPVFKDFTEMPGYM